MMNGAAVQMGDLAAVAGAIERTFIAAVIVLVFACVCWAVEAWRGRRAIR